jgi:cytochrome c oxidase subunit 3
MVLKKKRINHGFHMVTRSPWPLFVSLSALFLTLGLTAYMHMYSGGGVLFGIGFVSLLAVLAFWWRDVIREATFEGKHTQIVQLNHKFGFVLFIVSEIMFFFAFFWAFFHSSLSPAIEIGCIWPPAGVIPFNPWKVPLLNTFILLLSGLTITVCHHSILLGEAMRCENFFFFTILLAVLFTLVQLYEYRTSAFSISDGVYGSTFFMATGFHGLHVLIGTIFITVCFIRALNGHFTKQHHVGFECAAWYWHFVDVVWLFLFVVVYWWGGLR